jgi:hypothetical protein
MMMLAHKDLSLLMILGWWMVDEEENFNEGLDITHEDIISNKSVPLKVSLYLRENSLTTGYL